MYVRWRVCRLIELLLRHEVSIIEADDEVDATIAIAVVELNVLTSISERFNGSSCTIQGGHCSGESDMGRR